MRNFTEQELVRREKLNYIKEQGIDPFGQKFNVTSNSKDIKEEFFLFTHEELESLAHEVTVAGRIMTKRGKGKVGFFHLQDRYGQIQVYIRSDNVSELEYDLFDRSDIGDIVGITGTIMKTNTGELSVRATNYTHLTKALRPLPEKFHGLTDIEERFRRRYVDLIMNEDARRTAFMRPRIIRSIQNYLDNKGFVEVETPILGTILGGANARPFITHHNTLDISMYLRVATELNLKRLIVGGMDRVYEIGRCFRNEGMDKTHNPEFTMMELYQAYGDLETMMEIAEGIFSHVALDVLGTTEVEWQGQTISLKPPYKRISMTEAIKKEIGIDFTDNISLDEAKKLAKEHNIEVEDHFGYGHIIAEFFDKYVEEKIIQPTFVIDYPLDISPLAKKKKDDERFTERFEIFIAGKEYGNAFTELNDPIDQYERFEAQVQERELGNDEATEMDLDFVEALEYGMPPTGGLGIGIDRLIMFITGNDTIREIILFPTMKLK